MSSATRNTTGGLPAHLTPRFEIRPLGPEHLDCVTAIQLHANLYHSEKWRPVYAGQRARRCLVGLRLARQTLYHPLASGLSFGVFDTQFPYARETSREKGGAVYWDEFAEVSVVDEEGGMLLKAIDSPLVSFALAYDEFAPPPGDNYAGLSKSLPEMARLYGVMDELRRRSEGDRGVGRPERAGERIARMGTATRRDYEGRGLMKALAHFEMRDARARGVRSICINTSSDAVLHVWSQPPAPFRSEIVLRLSVRDHIEVDAEGRETRPYLNSMGKESVRLVCYLQGEQDVDPSPA